MTSSHSSAFSPDATNIAAHPIASGFQAHGGRTGTARLARLAGLLATILIVVALCGAFWWRTAEFALTLLRG